MEAEPLVSVLMPAYNAASFIGEAIESVLSQTYPHFELLVIDDGSTDDTQPVVQDLASGDPRIRLVVQEHAGLVSALNSGLQQARGRFLARLDADDRSEPQRLELQVRCLEAHPDLVIVGSAYQIIDPQGAVIRVDQMPQSDTFIRWHSLFHCPFAHPSVMLRLEALRAGGLSYNPAMQEAEDYDLWSRLLRGGRGLNLSQPLVHYRTHPTQASQQGKTRVWDFAIRVAQRNLAELGAQLSFDQVHRLREWYYRFPPRFTAGDLPLAEALLDLLNRFSLLPGLQVGEVKRLRGRWLARLLRAGLSGDDPRWGLRMLRRLDRSDWGAIGAYTRSRLQ